MGEQEWLNLRPRNKTRGGVGKIKFTPNIPRACEENEIRGDVDETDDKREKVPEARKTEDRKKQKRPNAAVHGTFSAIIEKEETYIHSYGIKEDVQSLSNYEYLTKQDHDKDETIPVQVGSYMTSFKSELYLLQMPHVLPSVVSEGKEETLEVLKESGKIGKMRIYKSGRAEMTINNNVFNICTGINSSFTQKLGMISLENNTISILGDIRKKLVLSPKLSDYIAD